MAVPALALVATMLLLPIVQTIYYSMTNWDGLTGEWIGLDNYFRLFQDPTFTRVLVNNLTLLLAVPVAVMVPFGLAKLLDQRVFGWRFFRTLFFIPTAASWVVTAMFGVRFFAQDGLLNDLLASIGFGSASTDMLTGQHTALIAIAITFAWSQIGTNTLIFSAGLATLDPTLEEAARLDGAGPIRIFLLITLPQMARFIEFAVVITVVTAFTALFSLIFIMTGGGPGVATTTLEFFVYQQAFTEGNFGVGAMLGVVLLVCIGGVVLAAIAGLSRLGRTD